MPKLKTEERASQGQVVSVFGEFFIKYPNALPILSFSIITTIFLGITLFTNTTGDDGDSIMHFLHSSYALKHPYLFLNMWNKPVFTFLSCLFASTGLTGIKIFNLVVAIGISYYLFALAKHFNKPFAWLIILLPVFSTFYLTVVNSGLTEPLFALTTVALVYYYSTQKHLLVTILVGLMPFVRQEGYIIMLLLIIFYIYEKRWDILPWVFTGHFVISIIGFYFYQDILWVFKNNPNIYMSHYGRGNWLDYFDKLVYVLGVPLYILFIIGIIGKVIKAARFSTSNSYSQYNILLYCCVFSILLAHTIFWKFGWFKSLGMNRNIITIFPLIIYIAFEGLFFILSWFKKRQIKNFVLILWTIYLIIFPFTPNPAAINWKKDFKLTNKQTQTDRWLHTLKHRKVTKLFTSYPYLIYKLNLDPFDSSQVETISKLNIKSAKKESIVVWDNWFSVAEEGISLKDIENNKLLKRDTTIYENQEPILIVYKVK